jgi:hypothetical protein
VSLPSLAICVTVLQFDAVLLLFLRGAFAGIPRAIPGDWFGLDMLVRVVKGRKTRRDKDQLIEERGGQAMSSICCAYTVADDTLCCWLSVS